MFLISLKRLIYVLTAIFLISCSEQKIVEDHFKDHGISYPLDISDVTLWNVKYAGIKDKELSAPGAREYIASGIVFIRDYFQRQDIQNFIPGARAIVLEDPVFYKDDTGKTGLMVKVTTYGAGKPETKLKLPIERIGADQRLWKAENFAYFSKNDYYKWQFNGNVY